MFRVYQVIAQRSEHSVLTGLNRFTPTDYFKVGRTFKKIASAQRKLDRLPCGYIMDDSSGKEIPVAFKKINIGVK